MNSKLKVYNFCDDENDYFERDEVEALLKRVDAELERLSYLVSIDEPLWDAVTINIGDEL